MLFVGPGRLDPKKLTSGQQRALGIEPHECFDGGWGPPLGSLQEEKQERGTFWEAKYVETPARIEEVTYWRVIYNLFKSSPLNFSYEGGFWGPLSYLKSLFLIRLGLFIIARAALTGVCVGPVPLPPYNISFVVLICLWMRCSMSSWKTRFIHLGSFREKENHDGSSPAQILAQSAVDSDLPR